VTGRKSGSAERVVDLLEDARREGGAQALRSAAMLAAEEWPDTDVEQWLYDRAQEIERSGQ
jgi:hypothetical protein